MNETIVPLKWSSAPVKTQWGAGMMAADVELDKDSTVTLYAHKDDLHKVAAALSALLDDNPTQEGRFERGCD